MAAVGLGLFLFEAAAGTALLLIFLPMRVLGKGFFSLHGTLVFFFLLLAVLVRPTGLPTVAATGAAILAGLYALAAHAGRPRLARGLLFGAAGGSLWSLIRVALAAPHGGDAWTVSSALAGGLLLGCALLTMNVGHWYLVSRSLPFELLSRGAALFAVLVGIRTLLLVAALAVDPNRSGLRTLLSLEQDGLFFLFRVLWGVVGPLALSYFIWKTADMRSNQAATGLLYVALLFVLIGELLSSYLTGATGFPA